MSLPNMKSKLKGKELILLATFPINGKYVLGVYQGSISEFDILLRYRQRDENTKSGWSRIRTPKHMHWAVDILLKMNNDEVKTKEFLDFLIYNWNNNVHPLKTKEARDELLNVKKLSDQINLESLRYETLVDKGEYSMKFLILIARLLMIQEKTNLEKAFMFKNLLDSLRKGDDIFKIVSIATHRK